MKKIVSLFLVVCLCLTSSLCIFAEKNGTKQSNNKGTLVEQVSTQQLPESNKKSVKTNSKISYKDKLNTKKSDAKSNPNIKSKIKIALSIFTMIVTFACAVIAPILKFKIDREAEQRWRERLQREAPRGLQIVEEPNEEVREPIEDELPAEEINRRIEAQEREQQEYNRQLAEREAD